MNEPIKLRKVAFKNFVTSTISFRPTHTKVRVNKQKLLTCCSKLWRKRLKQIEVEHRRQRGGFLFLILFLSPHCRQCPLAVLYFTENPVSISAAFCSGITGASVWYS